ncbi:MAG TPA: asparagine synthase-related protein [Candidatus Bathyarchaeia archaeon]|nr:asparagine synthase-related protein [Candidatus Bathyarchaeia archaeon]
MIIAVLDKRGEDATRTVVRVLKSLHVEHADGFGLATPLMFTMEKDAEALQNQDVNSPVSVGYTFSKILPQDEPQHARLENAALVFEGRIYSPTRNASATGIVAKKLKQNRDKAVEALFDEIEGDFSFIIAESQRIIAGRDPVGVQPLYYGENRIIAALASNRKALWKLGIKKTRSFPPGHLALVSHEGFKFKPVKTLVYSKPKPITMQKAAETLQKLLELSVRRRVWGLKEIAVAFSGGLDSSLIAFLAKRYCANVHLIHVSLKNRPETEEAKKAADELKLPIHVYLFREGDVEEVVSKVVELIEEPDPVKASIGIPFYWTAEQTAKTGFKVLLAGQGADELFGGYQRYINDYLLYGKGKVRRNMFNDAVELHESNIERDVKICSFHNVELRLPFASYQIANFAINLPVELKIEKKADSLRKLVLRKVADNIGLPTSITKKPKKAVQYATGINDALKKVAKKQKVTVKEYVNKLFLNQYDQKS